MTQYTVLRILIFLKSLRTVSDDKKIQYYQLSREESIQ